MENAGKVVPPGMSNLSASETTRSLQRCAIAAIAQLFSCCERSTHALLEPTTTARPSIPHAFFAEDQLGDIAVARTDAARIERHQSIAKQQAMMRPEHP